MFHVKRFLPSIVFKRIAIILVLFLLFSGCAVRQRTTILDYLILPNGKETLGTKELNAFIFENNQRNITFEGFLLQKFKLNSVDDREFWVTIAGEKYKLLIYDNPELEKYFRVSDFIITNQDPERIDSNMPKFIAISMISDRNDDCLSEKSLFYNIAVNYLRNLKDEYNP